MSNRSHSREFKYEVITAYKNEDYTQKELCSKYHINDTTFYRWIEIFKKEGISGLEESKSWKKYSKELKETAVLDYLSGDYSYKEIVQKYHISSDSVLNRWINKYNSHRKLKDTGKGRTRSMTKGRKTTWGERIEMAVYCLENKKDYQGTAEKYKVFYQQVYQWVKKYETIGSEALKDNRGRTKREAELSEEEKSKLEMKRLEFENERLRAELAFLKKLEEIERGRK
ncbi:transposase-like protein [Virgibacillus halotolerans]|uniref:helix-turn-helix domain-containing protein n=1 Tax=Virgibacillus halotolerans TaxID=1071053 RepID=UPI001960C1EF|nr:helix-turn-helix domain-containing protein [Virgibacillus halotolerans]MBM7597691.1 transposase-like protein [Virgibacillus halotolerans]